MAKKTVDEHNNNDEVSLMIENWPKLLQAIEHIHCGQEAYHKTLDERIHKMDVQVKEISTKFDESNQRIAEVVEAMNKIKHAYQVFGFLGNAAGQVTRIVLAVVGTATIAYAFLQDYFRRK